MNNQKIATALAEAPPPTADEFAALTAENESLRAQLAYLSSFVHVAALKLIDRQIEHLANQIHPDYTKRPH